MKSASYVWYIRIGWSVSHRWEPTNRMDEERRPRDEQISRRKRTYTGSKGRRDREASFSFFSHHPPRLVTISALRSAPSDESTSHRQCQYRLGYLVERTRVARAEERGLLNTRRKTRKREKEGCWNRKGEDLEDRKRRIWGGSPILGKSRVQCRIRIRLLHWQWDTGWTPNFLAYNRLINHCLNLPVTLMSYRRQWCRDEKHIWKFHPYERDGRINIHHIYLPCISTAKNFIS